MRKDTCAGLGLRCPHGSAPARWCIVLCKTTYCINSLIQTLIHRNNVFLTPINSTKFVLCDVLEFELRFKYVNYKIIIGIFMDYCNVLHIYVIHTIINTGLIRIPYVLTDLGFRYFYTFKGDLPKLNAGL